MKSIRKHASLFVTALALVGLLFLAVPNLAAQGIGPQDKPPAAGDADDNFNPPPCDFSDQFYQDNGINLDAVTGLNAPVAGRFGNSPNGRQFGPPATGNQANWVVDTTNCAAKDPTRRNIRILATTAGYIDDGTGSPTDFISLIAFLTNQSDFSTDYSRTVGSNGNVGPGNTITIDSNGLNPRGHAMQGIISSFEAYGALKQTLPSGPFAGKLAPTPCKSMGDPTLPAGTPCFSVDSVATPNLRQDWRFATNRQAIDGSDGNNPVAGADTPFGYFCDDLLGAWIITYFWFTHHGVGNPATGEQPDTTQCIPMFNQLKSMHGTTLDGTPIIVTGDELNFLEGKPITTQPLGPNFPNPPSFPDLEGCAAEGNEDATGGDTPASIWLICPGIPDPRAGAIAQDAFLDQVRKPNGDPLDPNFTVNFLSLQIFGVFPNEIGQLLH
jgi:hypothetical protein